MPLDGGTDQGDVLVLHEIEGVSAGYHGKNNESSLQDVPSGRS
jgi:hypothetical protein